MESKTTNKEIKMNAKDMQRYYFMSRLIWSMLRPSIKKIAKETTNDVDDRTVQALDILLYGEEVKEHGIQEKEDKI